MTKPLLTLFLAATLCAGACMCSDGAARQFTLWALAELKLGLTAYAFDCDQYPPESMGLRVLVSSEDVQWSGPYCRGNPLNDGWGEPIGYVLTNGLVVLSSSGPDKKRGTPDDMTESWSSDLHEVSRHSDAARSNRWEKVPNQAFTRL